MFFEYAIEPECVATWHSPESYRFFSDKFGIGTGRIIAEYPTDWRARVFAARDAIAPPLGTIEKRRVEELVDSILKPRLTRANQQWNDNLSWIENALEEHRRAAFSRILVTASSIESDAIVPAPTLQNALDSRWISSHSFTVGSIGCDIADHLRSLLRSATTILLVDPHFRPTNAKWDALLQTVFHEIASRNSTPPPRQVEVLCRVDQHAVSETEFRNACNTRIREIMPSGLRVTFRLLRTRRNGEMFHNRYVLTDLCSVLFPAGLDLWNDRSAKEDLVRLDTENARYRFNQYLTFRRYFEEIFSVSVRRA